MNMEKISAADREAILQAYRDIESPCHYCKFREDHTCTFYGLEIVEDSQDIFIPTAECEETFGSLT